MKKSWITGSIASVLVGTVALAGTALAQTVEFRLGHVDVEPLKHPLILNVK